MNFPYNLKDFEVVGGKDYSTKDGVDGVELNIRVQNRSVKHRIDFRESSLEPKRFLESLGISLANDQELAGFSDEDGFSPLYVHPPFAAANVIGLKGRAYFKRDFTSLRLTGWERKKRPSHKELQYEF